MAGNSTLILLNEPFYHGIKIASYVIAAVIFVGNGLTMVTIITQKSLHTKSNVFIFNVCVADFYIVVITVVVYTARSPDTLRVKVYTVEVFALVCGYVISVFSLVAIAAERFISIRFPFKYERFMNKTTMAITLMVMWIIPSGLVLAGFVLTLKFGPKNDFSHRLVLSLQYTYVLLAVSLVIMYISILITAYKQAKEIKKNMVNSAAKTRFTSEIKATVTLGVVVMAFILTWSPLTILVTAELVKLIPVDIHYQRIYLVLNLTGYCNSAVNIFIYAWTNSSFRKAYYLTLTCNWRWNSSVEPVI